MTSHPVTGEPRRCSELSAAAAEPLAGTAPKQGTWLLLEHGPPWGQDALAESRLAPAVAAELEARAKAASVKVVLVRPALRASAPPPRRPPRRSQPCRRCRTPIVRERWSNRSTYFCPQCQPRPRPSRQR